MLRKNKQNRGEEKRARHVVALLGPAFVAAVAYVDPGNFAANFSAGAQYGFMLLWVLVVANLMAMLVQYLSAKIGVVTGMSLPQVVATKLGRKSRIAYWIQAELVAAACDLAEIIGGAIALKLLFNVPLVAGGIITGVVSLLLLATYHRRGQKIYERIIIGLLLIIPVGFVVGLFMHPPEVGPLVGGLLPRLEGERDSFAGRRNARSNNHAACCLSPFGSFERSSRQADRLTSCRGVAGNKNRRWFGNDLGGKRQYRHACASSKRFARQLRG